MWLVVGASGQLGRCMTELLEGKSTSYVAMGHHQLDITDAVAVEIIFKDLKPTIVLNAAAWTAVDDAEEHEAEALSVNAHGPANLALSSSSIGARLIHISTDYVFDGQANTPYTVNSPTEPINAYGRTKLAGEEAVLESVERNNCVVRTAWLYSEHGKNFAKTMTVRALRGEPVRVVNDQLGQPTSAHDLGQLIWSISQLEKMPSTVHGTNAGQATWFQFAQEIYSQLGADPALVSPVDTSAFPTVAKRPAYSVLDHADFASWGLKPLQNWQDGLADSITQIRSAIQKEASL
jgi:dTDP-4-dehydrorhamnose reductase